MTVKEDGWKRGWRQTDGGRMGESSKSRRRSQKLEEEENKAESLAEKERLE